MTTFLILFNFHLNKIKEKANLLNEIQMIFMDNNSTLTYLLSRDSVRIMKKNCCCLT